MSEVKPSAWLKTWPDGTTSLLVHDKRGGVPLWTAEGVASALRQAASDPACAVPSSLLLAASYIRDHLSPTRTPPASNPTPDGPPEAA